MACVCVFFSFHHFITYPIEIAVIRAFIITTYSMMYPQCPHSYSLIRTEQSSIALMVAMTSQQSHGATPVSLAQEQEQEPSRGIPNLLKYDSRA